MSASLDDIPPYERFQIELDECLQEMLVNKITINEYHIHLFIEYITFQYFIDTLAKLPSLLIENYLEEQPKSKEDLRIFLNYLNETYTSEHQKKLSIEIKKALI
jgi:hypothetical protein